MKNIQLVLFTVLVLSVSSIYAQQDARWVITRSIEALGGEKALRSVQTLQVEMATEMNGRPVTWVTREMIPNKGSFQIIYEGRTVYQDWFNGREGFEMEEGKVKQKATEELEDKLARRNIFNEFDYLNPILYKLEKLADERMSGVDCYVVKASSAQGLVRLMHFDKSSFYCVREVLAYRRDISEASATYFSDFKKFGPIVMYGTMVMGDGADAQKAIISKVLINEGITEKDFDPKH
jgi:hypothetical protein